jgi:tryptophan synthase alpha chain
MRVGIYFTLGDFGLDGSLGILQAAARAGAGLLEVGLPFSDPLLDGPVIQAGHQRALAGGEIPWDDVCAAVA